MGDTAGLQINVGADVSAAIAGIGKLDDSVETLEKALARIDYAITNALAAGRDTSALEADFERVRAKLVALQTQAAKPIPPPVIPPIPAPDDTALLNSVTKQRIAFTDLGRIITGQGFTLRTFASNFALLGPGITIAAAAIYGLVELFTKQTDAEKKATEEAKKLKETLANLKSGDSLISEGTGSEAGNIARVQALAQAITDTNKPYKERQNALNELRETNKAYFGDLTLEAASLKTITERVNEYSNALVIEAIIKKQSGAIADLTSNLLDQVRAEDKLRTARDQAQQAVDNAPRQAASAGNVASGGNDATDILFGNLNAANAALEKQKEAVFKIREQIAIYNGDLHNAINEQAKFKPLVVPPHYGDDLKSIIPILEQIKKIYDDINKPNKEPLFKQVADSTDKNSLNLIQAQIAEAIKKGAVEGAKDPAIRQAYADLATALQAKLAHVQNPDLHSRVQGIVEVKAEDVDNIESKIEKALGGSKGLQIKVPATFKLDLERSGYGVEEQKILLKNAEEDAVKGLPPIRWTPAIQVLVNKGIIETELKKQLQDALNKSIKGVASSGLENLGQSIGKAIASGASPIEAAGKSIISSLGSLIQDIGKNLIEYGIVKEGLDNVLAAGIALPGVAAIAIGVAAEAIGALVKNTGSSYKAFATGGIVTGPTLGLVGEAGPEVIFPLNQLNRFVKNTQGSGQQTVRVVGRLSGRDINIASARDNKMQSLV